MVMSLNNQLFISFTIEGLKAIASPAIQNRIGEIATLSMVGKDNDCVV